MKFAKKKVLFESNVYNILYLVVFLGVYMNIYDKLSKVSTIAC